MIKRKCLRCGKEFHFYPYEKNTRKYCSMKCRDPYIVKKCLVCKKTFKTYLSRIKVGWGKYCSLKCYAPIRNKKLGQGSIKYRYRKGHKNSPEMIRKIIESHTGEKNKLWKGENVGYRGLHYWLRRVKGIPMKCEICGLKRTTPKSIHWANINHKYRRNPDDYIALCKSCHKLYDKSLI